MSNTPMRSTQTGTSALQKGLKDQLVQARQRSLDGMQQGPHSLELVGTVKGVQYVNDSRSTFLDASLRSLNSLQRKGVWVLSTGVQLPETPWFEELMLSKVKALVLYGKDGHFWLDRARKHTHYPYHVDELRTAVFLARELAEQGDVVLFSPASPSRDGYANYEERGVAFKQAVKDL